MNTKFCGALLIALISISFNAYAIPVKMEFTLGGSNFFINDPRILFSGTFIWDAASVNSPIRSLLSVDLTIDGHTYTLEEIGFASTDSFPVDIIGGLAGGGIGQFTSGTDDFSIDWDRPTSSPRSFSWTTANDPNSWFHQNSIGFSKFNIAAVPVPLPSAFPLMLGGLAGLGLTRCRLIKT